MYKLLPEEQKKIVAQEYGIRRAVVMLAASILVMLLGTAGLFPSYMLSGARRQEVLERTRIMGDVAPKEDEAALQEWLSGFNAKLQTLTAFAETAEPTRLIDKVLEEKVAGIRLTGFVWTFAKNKATLAVSGTARDRQALIALEDSLNASGQFGSVSLPLSNLARDKDIEFQVNLTLAQTP